MTLDPNAISWAVRKSINEKYFLKNKDASILFYSYDLTQKKLNELKTTFTENTHHTIAIKANPLSKVLSKIVAQGFGLEAASIPELYIALKTGIEGKKIVYDSPVKTEEDLRYAIEAGSHINADSLAELARIDNIMSDYTKCKASFGLRINPQTGDGKIAATSVAGVYSKFGVPINERRQEIISAYKKYPWLTGIHIHIGSQGCSLEMLVKGAKLLSELITDIESELIQIDASLGIKQVDIGGGLPASYDHEIPTPTLTEYATKLKNSVPELFSQHRTVITEFGRHIHAPSGFVISRVEYVKTEASKNTLMIHVGADMFVRECYRPDDWHHEIIVLNPDGTQKHSQSQTIYNIAGPLCFAGDIIAHDRLLPTVTPGDYVVILDSGAYTFAMWSRYNSRQTPKVIGFSVQENFLEIIKDQETLEDVYGFWL